MQTAARTRESASKDAEAIAVLRRSAGRLMDRLPELTDRVVTLIQRHEPSYRAPAVDPDELWEEVNRSLRYSVGCLTRPREMEESARRCSWHIGARRAEQGLPLDALLHAFRLGGGTVWQELLDAASRRDPDSPRLLVHVAGNMWNFVDAHCSLVSEAYRRTERELAWRRENRLWLMAEALLTGTARVADLPDIAAALDLPERGQYAAVALAGPAPARAAYRATRPGVPRATAGGSRLVWHPGVDADLALVHLGDGGTERLAADLRPGPGPGTDGAGLPRIGVSPAVDGLAAVGDARALAEKALRCCRTDGEVALLTDHLPAALAASSPDLAAVLTERALGPLLRLDPADRDILLDTLTAWLDCDASAQRAGERLSCHRNTVLNRLRRYEKLTGRSLSRPRDTTELSLALTARRMLAP